jgi:para-nitrobenzyl esterase
VSTCALLGVPEVEGLVHRAIVQSGTCEQRSSTVYRMQVGDPWLAASPCASADDVAACLRALSVEDVLTNEPTGFPSVSALSQVWSPYVDGITLPASTLDAMASGDDVDVPIVIGANADETARDVPQLDEDTFAMLVDATFGPFAMQVKDAYPLADYDSPTAAYVALTSDVKFSCGARRAARAAQAAGRAPVYRYHFSYDGYTAPASMDASAFHGLELVYVFGNFAAIMFGPLAYTPNADDEAMASWLGEAWTTFARTGDPSTAALAWPSYASGDDPFAALDLPPASGDGVRTEQCDFWDDLLGG